MQCDFRNDVKFRRHLIVARTVQMLNYSQQMLNFPDGKSRTVQKWLQISS